VFLAFVLSGDRVIAMFGIALASAVALDAFVLRTLLVPALMHMLGGANWWLPRWLDRRLPRISIEPPDCRAVSDVSDVSDIADAAEKTGTDERSRATIPGQRADGDDPVTGDELDDELVVLVKERQQDVRDIPG
jgi:RND superfamily putative drug exporter